MCQNFCVPRQQRQVPNHAPGLRLIGWLDSRVTRLSGKLPRPFRRWVSQSARAHLLPFAELAHLIFSSPIPMKWRMKPAGRAIRRVVVALLTLSTAAAFAHW
jgi:hypothetical protein